MKEPKSHSRPLGMVELFRKLEPVNGGWRRWRHEGGSFLSMKGGMSHTLLPLFRLASYMSRPPSTSYSSSTSVSRCLQVSRSLFAGYKTALLDHVPGFGAQQGYALLTHLQDKVQIKLPAWLFCPGRVLAVIIMQGFGAMTG